MIDNLLIKVAPKSIRWTVKTMITAKNWNLYLTAKNWKLYLTAKNWNPYLTAKNWNLYLVLALKIYI